jgi:hypothetical protein
MRAFTFCLLLLAAPFAGAADFPVDPTFKQQEEKLAVAVKECRAKHKNIVASTDCEKTAKQTVMKERAARGAAYAEQNYKTMTNSKAVETWKDLKKMRDKARSKDEFSSTNKRPPGELTKEMLTDEMKYINTELNNRGSFVLDESDNPNKPELTKH